MMLPLVPITLSPEQEGQILGILSVGCDRETAANVAGCTTAEIALAMRDDPKFAQSVRRTEAMVEMALMRTVNEAAKDPKNWRAAVWWLECRSPERFASRGAGTVTSRQLKTFVQVLSHHLNDDVKCPEDRERVLNRLAEIESFADLIRDDLWTHPSDDDSETASEAAIAESTSTSGVEDQNDHGTDDLQWT
jgi:hypothetical protein